MEGDENDEELSSCESIRSSASLLGHYENPAIFPAIDVTDMIVVS